MNKTKNFDRKFESIIDVFDWQIETDSGWKDIVSIGKTVPYSVYEVVLEDNISFKAADTHIVFDEHYNEVFVKDLMVNQSIITKDGLKKVKSVDALDQYQNMFDIEVDSAEKRYFANNVLHHNTTCSASYMLWRAMFQPDQTILVVAHNLNQALEITGRIRFAYEELPSYIKAGVTEYNKGSIIFDNGSRIISRAASPNAARGLSISLLYMDELSFIRKKMQEEFWAAISPTLATGGDCIITSTPGSDEDLFATLWRQAEDIFDINGNMNPGGVGKNGFKTFKATWRDHPERDEEWAQRERSKIGDAKFFREFECQFISHSETLIDQIVLSSLQGIEPIKTQGQVRWYKEVEPNKTYIACLDPSMGTGSDPAAIQVYSIPNLEQVAEWRSNQHPIKFQVQTLLNILKTIELSMKNNPLQQGIPEIYWSVENNTVGEAALNVIENTGEEHFPGTWIHEPKMRGNVRRFRKGLCTTHKSKIVSCAKLKSLIEQKKIKIYSKALIRELKYFESAGTTYKAKQGETDDLIMATLLCLRIIDIISNWNENIVNEINDSVNTEEQTIEPMPFVFLTNYK